MTTASATTAKRVNSIGCNGKRFLIKVATGICIYQRTNFDLSGAQLIVSPSPPYAVTQGSADVAASTKTSQMISKLTATLQRQPLRAKLGTTPSGYPRKTESHNQQRPDKTSQCAI